MTKMNKMREEIIKNFVDCLKKDTIPWHKSWSSVGHPRNAVSEKSYQGLNFFWLEFVQSINGYEDPRWCTFKQATDAGWKIKKGSKGVHVEFWSLYDTEVGKKVSYADAKVIGNGMTDEEFKERFKPISNTYTVFNAEQIEGIPAYVEKTYQLNAEELLLRKDTLIKNMEVGFEEGGDRAYYTEVLDRITLPEVNRFESEYDYMATLLHEAAHATGHTSRLNRDMEGVFGSPKYAREELRAEIASAFTAQILGIDYSQNDYMENHEAYVKNWIGVLQNAPEELFTAIKDAEKISDYLIEKGEFNKQLSMTNDDMHVKKSEQPLFPETNFVNISGILAQELMSQQINPIIMTDNNGVIVELNTPQKVQNSEGNMFYINKTQFAQALPHIAPVVKCEWSESEEFDDGKYYTIKEFDDLMRTTDYEFCTTREKIKAKYDTEYDFYNTTNPEEYRYIGYEKNKYTIYFSPERTVTERQDVGDNEGGIIEHFSKIASLNEYVNEMKAAIEKNVKNKPELTPIQENLKRINDNVNHCAKIADNIGNPIYVAIQTTDEHVSYEQGFHPDTNGNVRYRLIHLDKENNIVKYPENTNMIFNSREEVNKYLKNETKNLVVVSTDDLKEMAVGKPPLKAVKIDRNADVGNLFDKVAYFIKVRGNGNRIKKTYDLPNVMNTLKKDYLAGKISIEEAARKMKQCNMTEDIVSNDRALKMMGLKEEIKNPQPQKNISR